MSNDSPLQDPSYLLSTVETITDSSLHEQTYASIHDLLDAYTTFTNRVRSQCQLLEACDTLFPALAPLKTHKDAFVRALRCHVRLAHMDTLSAVFRPCLSLDDSSFGSSIHLNVAVDAKQYARDSSSLCHHALCIITTIFRFPAFHLVFPERDLLILFGDVLDIALAEQLPVLSQAKTYSLSLWTLGSHRLPAAVLDSRRDDVFYALQRCLNGTRHPDNILLDGLKAISHTIEHHPSGFLDLLFPLVPFVMGNLHCESSGLRLHACIALVKFANALLHQTELSLTRWQTLSDHITSYLESCCDESQIASGSVSFLHVVRAAFSAESHVRPGVAPTWVLAILASLIVLCGPALYRKPTALRLILRALAIALTHKRSIIRALHPHVWRCLVWTFNQMLINSEDVEPALISSAFCVVKQEVDGGIGMALASLLLSDRMPAIRSDERGDRVSQALLVIKAMVRSKCKHTRREGFMFLQAFTSSAQVRHQVLQSMYQIPASILLNGAIIGAKWDSLPSTIHSIPKVPVPIRWLEDSEIAQHYKTLLMIWKHFSTKADRKDLDSSLVDVWSFILFACSHQLECQQDITAVSDMLKYTALIIVEFLPSVVLEDCQPNWGSWNVHDQLCRLRFISQLWSAMRKAFVAFSLAEIAELVLASILKLCANLMTTASPSFLRDIHDPTASQLIIRGQRELWGVVATSLSPPEVGLEWKELVHFLAIPICTWVLSKPELEAWEALLRNVVTASGDCATVIDHFVVQYLQGKEVETWESVIAVLGFLFACAHEHRNSPTDNLLSVANVCLTVSYSLAVRSREVLADSLELLSVIRHTVVSAPGNVMHILQALCNGLCVWIEDHVEVMSNDEFNSVAVSLYCETLEALEILPLSIQVLRDTEDFLASAFSRIPMPARAPFAFEKFWRATYHGHSQFRNILPSKIKSCLACFVAAYGGDLADGLSLATESQSQSINNGSQVHFPASHQHQGSGEFSLRASLSLTPRNAEAWSEVSDMEVALHGYQQDQDVTLPIPSSNDMLQPTVLRQLQEYSSRPDASSLYGSERSTSDPQIHLSPTFPPSGATPSSHSPEKNHSFTSSVPHKRRKLADADDPPKKRNQTSRDALRLVRKLESEPATREVTPINVPRMHSVPPRKRMVFDGVQVPTFCKISHQNMAQRAKTGKNILGIGQGLVSVPKAPTRKKRRASPSTLPLSVGSDEDGLDWENPHINATSSSKYNFGTESGHLLINFLCCIIEEVDVDRSLADVCPSSLPWSRTSAPRGTHERDDESHRPLGLTLPKAMSQGESSGSAPARPSLRRARTTSARLDALQDVYTSVAHGASQIPISELVQATRLVYQIGAVLTEQMGKKMDDPG